MYNKINFALRIGDLLPLSTNCYKMKMLIFCLDYMYFLKKKIFSFCHELATLKERALIFKLPSLLKAEVQNFPKPSSVSIIH